LVIQAWIDQFVEKGNQQRRLPQMQRAADCDKAVREVMKARPDLSYHQAWDVAKSENPSYSLEKKSGGWSQAKR
jgi:hypothetical protein